MEYYRSNAIYQAIEISDKQEDFAWASKNNWILVYGAGNAIPKLIVLASGTSSNEIPTLTPIVEELSRITRIPSIGIEFDDASSTINSVVLRKSLSTPHGTEISLTALQSTFASFGLPISNDSIVKAINDKASSAYHNWQRQALGGQITVSDIDLFRLHKRRFVEVMELKRSYYPLDQWKPFPEDYKNFQLIANLLSQTGIPLNIVYNQRTTKPHFNDDPSRLCVFSFKNDSGPQVTRIGKVTLQEFLEGKYLAK
jgi:hypothetical protein